MPAKKKMEEEVITEMPPVETPEVVVEPEPTVVPPVAPAPVAAPVVTSSEPAKKEGSWWMLLVAFILGLVVGAVTMYLIKAQSSKLKTQSETTVVSETPAPSAIPVSEVKRADLKVQVLNGSGVAGAAAKAKEFLEGLGYVDVAAGNADGDFAETEIEIKDDKKSALEMLKKDLETDYTLSDTIGVLDESSDYDVVITLGAE
ncbi:MAG: hypothetical protein UU42_C0025G0001 [Candidatus Woesebacteria bacterium GW2011_GWA1_41_13b]|uniref:LytR/CpsA/Psr regulator C-terminal domain-containing protein n=1 Tax=Candidatus Woesebacteria bacterium GW2011_GWA1_41_13b TaxID=1618555 RepID=A0A0G0UQE8_9BACT|nr:MAG: hypothetical protein UU42_C0025G0001 [Candidatus Woesebacteria bacterium GW2011_GWA1_41_13b]